MKNLSQKGIATVATVVAVFAVAGGAVGVPIAVDEMDVNPTHPLYALERAGEGIKEATYADGLNWDLERAMERTEEYRNVASERISNNHVDLLEDAGQRIFSAVKNAKDTKGLQKVREVIQKHEQVLKRVEDKVNENAKPAISLARSRSAKARMIIQDVETGEIPGKQEVAERVQKAKQEMKGLEKEVRESIQSGKNPREVAQGVGIRTAEEMTEKFAEMAEKSKAEEYTTLAEEAQNLLQNVAQNAVDNTGIQRAMEAVQKHVQVLERVRDQVPSNAKPAIERALQNSQRAISVLENVLENIPDNVLENVPENIGPPENVLENIPDNVLENVPENIGPPENAGQPENPGSQGNSSQNQP